MSRSERSVRVEVTGGNAEVQLVDSSFTILSRGIGQIQQTVPTGIYKVRTMAGGAIEETLIDVEPGETVQSVELSPPAFRSPLPLEDTSTSREYHQLRVAQAMAAPFTKPLGQGAGAIVIVRDPSGRNFRIVSGSDEASTYANAYRGFRLLNEHGDSLLDFDVDAQLDLPYGFLAAHSVIGAGQYLLARESVDDAVVMPFLAVAGWQTGVFFNLRFRSDGTAAPDMTGRTLNLTGVGSGFVPNDEQLRLAEIARHALEGKCSRLARNYLEQLVKMKFRDPVFGLMGAHIMLAEDKLDAAELDVVLSNLEALLGPSFPDVAALRLAVPAKAGDGENIFDFPPLLHASLRLIRERVPYTAQGPLVREAIENSVGDGVWVTWRRMRSLSSQRASGRQTSLRSSESGNFGMVLDKVLKRGAGIGPLHIARHAADEGIDEDAEEDVEGDVEEDAMDPSGGPLEVLERLAHRVDWEELLSAKGADRRRRLVGELSGLQRMLLPSLLLMRRRIQSGDPPGEEDWEQLKSSLALSDDHLRALVLDLAMKALTVEGPQDN